MNKLYYQIIGFVSSTRLLNVIVLCITQYLVSIYILAPERSLISIVLDLNLFIIIFATAVSTLSGYIINNFYDFEKDKINRPKLFFLSNLISKEDQLKIYFFFNIITITVCMYLSIKAFAFYLFYIFMIWLYSYRIKKLYWISNFFSSAIVIYPFFALILYFGVFSMKIILMALFLYNLLFLRDVVKDLQNFKGDWIQKYKTLPIIHGVFNTKIIASFFSLFTFIISIKLLSLPLGKIYFYFLFSIFFVLMWSIYLWIYKNQKNYLCLHNSLKIWILIGVYSITLIS
ncbi:MAG: ubiquinone biosynthesis protein UbiA [Flavobacteriaceae bacterium]|nr:ubiquinone biosynthesis protein UbiA [Flavobacteriaceae bacterium]